MIKREKINNIMRRYHCLHKAIPCFSTTIDMENDCNSVHFTR